MSDDLVQELDLVQTQALAARSAMELAPVMDVAAAAARYEQLVDFMRRVLRDGVDYGVIPGTGDKPSLYLAGAQKIAMFYGLRPAYEIIERTEDWQHGFFAYSVQCLLYQRASGRCIGAGIGECNSLEEKYRYGAWRAAEKPSEDIMALKRSQNMGRFRRDKESGKWVWEEREERPVNQVYSLPNTLIKMGKKRAYVDAVITATAASEFVTQDLEEMAGFYAADAPLTSSRPEQKKTGERNGNGGHSGNGSNGGNGGNGHPATAPEWLKYADVIQALRRALPNMQALTIAERLAADKDAKPTDSLDSLVARLRETAVPPAPAAAQSIVEQPAVADVEEAGRWLDALRAKIVEAGQVSTGEPTEAQRKYANSLISQILDDKEARNAFRVTIVGEPSLAACNRGMVKVIIEALADDAGKGPNAQAQAFARAIFQSGAADLPGDDLPF